MLDYFPISLDVLGERCLVVGAGVAAEKISSLLGSGADVCVVAAAASPAIEAMAESGAITLQRRPFQPSDLDDAQLVIAATDDAAVNCAVCESARERGILVNAEDDPARCDFILPTVVSSDPFQITVSTGGYSPALARLLRQRLEAAIGPEFGQLAVLLRNVRNEAREAGLRVPAAAWADSCDDYVLDLLRTEHHVEALHLLRTRLVSATLAADTAPSRNLSPVDDDLAAA